MGCSTQLREPQGCPCDEISCAGHLHQQKDTSRAPPYLCSELPLPSHSHLSPDQSPAASEHPEVLASAQVALVHHPQCWCRAAWPPRSTRQNHPPLLFQSHKATGTTSTPGLPCRPLPSSLGSLLSETKPWPPAPQGEKPVQVLDSVCSLQFPLSTTSLHTCVPLIHTQAGNSGMTQMMRLSVLIMSICECNLHSLASEASLSFCHPFCALRKGSQCFSKCRIAQGRAHGMGHAH